MAKKINRRTEKVKNNHSDYKIYIDWIMNNWKTVLIVSLTVFIMFYMKVAEEMSSDLYGKQSDEDLYAILDLSSSATSKDIKKQYNKLVLEYHPDKNPNCTVCEEKMGKISKAYEILSNEEAKMHYDQTNGILEPIKSITTSLHKFNYQKLVEESPRPWVIQVYSENSSSCQSFSGFWEDFALEYNFLQFGRINYGSQTQLVRKLPFAADDLPLVVSMFPGQEAEAFGFWGDRSPNAEFRTFIKHSLGHHYLNITDSQLVNHINKKNTEKPELFLVGIDNIPVFFQYISYYYNNVFDIFMTQFQYRRDVQKQLKDPNVTFVVKPPSHISTPIRYFNREQSKETIASVLRYSFFLTLPGILIRNL